MMALSNYLATSLFHKGVIPEKDIPVYEYAWQLILSTLVSSVVILTIGALSGNLPQALAFLIIFCGMRAFAGGYHASTHLTCFLCAQVVFLVTLAAQTMLPKELASGAALIMLAVADGILLWLAPTKNKVSPRPERVMQRNRRRMCNCLLVLNLVVVASVLLMNAPLFWFYCSSTLMAVAILVIVNQIQINQKKEM